MSEPEDESARAIAALRAQNRLLLEQVEALRAALATREDEITRLSARLLDRESEPPAPHGLLARLRPRWR
ncbi:hypothetical protein [uncultured Roseovarius sp.]|uniref:hypothetical protein n=1 Tax=uncultured Roseovarius sp. TaxID=293344 RepID=UPI000C55DABF|nr:hypothetical protein [Roseovarius sp.]MBD12263.1 hypothetical protein [Roseovarius sp.]